MTKSNPPLLTVVGLAAVCAIAAIIWVGVSIRGLRGELEASRKETQTQMATIAGNLGLVQGELAMIRNNPLVSGPMSPTDDGVAPEQFKTDADAVAAIVTLRKSPDAASWAGVIADIDGWLVKPEDQAAVQNRLTILIPRLRILIRDEVTALQKSALSVTPSAAGAKKLDEAGKILALYPMSDDQAVIEEAGRLADSQMDAATRLDALRRQRYNRWAVDEIALAIGYYNEDVSRWNLTNDNTALLPKIVAYLGQLDPMYLEPAVLELYNYIIDKMKGSLSEKNKLEFAKQLTDPGIARKRLGDL